MSMFKVFMRSGSFDGCIYTFGVVSSILGASFSIGQWLVRSFYGFYIVVVIIYYLLRDRLNGSLLR